MRPFRLIAASTALATTLLLAGCGGDDATVANGDGASGATTATVAWMLDAEPAGVVPVGEAKASASEGDRVVVFGRIGGNRAPMTEGSPVFLIVDKKLPHCGEIPGDNCPVPWDYCCEPKDSLTANSATVQLVAGEGADPMAAGLEPLDEVVIVGTVGPRPNQDVFTIMATGVYRRSTSG
ncbi:MAG: hypothetical protein AB8G96_05075 [Phycisphaerales bacterium]